MRKFLKKIIDDLSFKIEDIHIKDLKDTIHRQQVYLKGKSEVIDKQYHVINTLKKELESYKENIQISQENKSESDIIRLNSVLKEKEENIQTLSDQNLDLSSQLNASISKNKELEESYKNLEKQYTELKSDYQVSSLNLRLQTNLTEEFFSKASQQESKLKQIQTIARKCSSCPHQNCEDATRLDCREEIVDQILQILQ